MANIKLVVQQGNKVADVELAARHIVAVHQLEDGRHIAEYKPRDSSNFYLIPSETAVEVMRVSMADKAAFDASQVPTGSVPSGPTITQKWIYTAEGYVLKQFSDGVLIP